MGIFKEIKETVVSLAKGLKITLKYWVKPGTTITVQYPEERRELSDRFRGILFNDAPKCTACSACVIACPVGCIKVVPVGKGKARKPRSFIIDISQCMFCGLCVDACPTGSLQHTKEVNMARFQVDELKIEYVSPEMAERFTLEAEAYEKEQAEKAAQKDAQQKESSGTENRKNNVEKIEDKGEKEQ